MMKILGIDQSLNNTGVIILLNDKIIYKGIIKSGILRGAERLQHIRTQIQNIFIVHHDINYVVIEDYSYGSRGRATFSLGELGGILKQECFIRRNSFQTAIISPMTHKKYICGKGNIEKSLVGKYVYKKYDFDNDDNNIIDAFCLAKTLYDFLLYSQSIEREWTKVQLEVFKKMKEGNLWLN